MSIRGTCFLLPCALLAACSGGSTAPRARALAPSSDEGAANEEDDFGLDFDPETLVQFELIANTPTLQPKQEATLGALFHIEKGWHVYWVNPGESGLPTKIKLEEGQGVVLGAPHFPGPVSFDSTGEIINYGYHTELLVPSPSSRTRT